MKTFLLIFIFSLSLNADSAYESKCVKRFYLTSVGTTHRINIVYSSRSNPTYVYPYSSVMFNELLISKDLFEYDSVTGRCNLIDKNNTLGMTNEQYNFMMALTGVLIGSLILFFIIGI